jgi:hypothetical protein
MLCDGMGLAACMGRAASPIIARRMPEKLRTFLLISDAYLNSRKHKEKNGQMATWQF